MNHKDLPSKIDAAYDADKPQKPRSYIGASSVGAKCEAQVAYSLRGMPDNKPDGQLQRIFNLGHIIEDVVIKDMQKAGVSVLEKDPQTGRQFEYKEWGGHISSHADGIIEEVTDDGDVNALLLEIKSMNDNKFKECEKKGVKYSHPMYYAQMQFMMGLGGFQKAVFVSYNKNNSAYLTQVIEYDPFDFSALEARVEKVLSNKAQKCATDETDWRCKGCFKRGACWNKIDVPVQCKTCKHAFPTDDGEWRCDLKKIKCDEPCDEWDRYFALPKT